MQGIMPSPNSSTQTWSASTHRSEPVSCAQEKQKQEAASANGKGVKQSAGEIRLQKGDECQQALCLSSMRCLLLDEQSDIAISLPMAIEGVLMLTGIDPPARLLFCGTFWR